MRSHLLDSETAIPAMISKLLGREVTPASLRRAETSGGFDSALWDRLRELGADSIDDLDGMDEPERRLCHVLVSGEMGRHLAPVPYVEHLIAVRLAHLLGVTAEWRVGDWVVAATVDDTLNRREGELSPAAAIADRILRVGEAECGIAETRAGAPEHAALANLARLPAARITPRILAPARRAPLMPAARQAWLSDRVLLPAATILGAGERAAELTLDYVRTRVQFGQPLGSFQVVRHRLAQLAVELTSARLLLLRACSYPIDDPAAAHFATVAASTCAGAGERSAREMLQLFGGYGYSLEYDAHRFLRFAKAWAVILRERIARVPADASVRFADQVVETSWS
jgi:hypothetical protein